MAWGEKEKPDDRDADGRRSGDGTHAVFIAGTDTGIGKTHTACGLIHSLARSRLQHVRHEAGGQRQRADGAGFAQ